MITTRRSALPALVVALAACVVAISASDAPAAAYRSCVLTSVDQYPRSGKPTYNSSLRARATPCATAKRVMRSYQSCRSKTSVRCSRRVLGRWRCSARTESTNPVTKDFTARFTCTLGARAVRGTYQQDV